MSNQRQYNRSSVRTLVTVLTEDERGRQSPRVFKSWTEDISASGMQVVCHEELPEGRIYVRILLPELEGKIVECSIVRRGRRKSNALLKDVGPRYVYGVQFESVQPLSDFEEMLAAAHPSAVPVRVAR
jgi:c-di-GMP-binding flagellar brake protein YcgR